MFCSVFLHNLSMYHSCSFIRSTPIETLHTVLLGPYKYLLKQTLSLLSPRQKEELLARIRVFNYSGFRVRLVGNVVRYHQSFVGRDYKALAQMAPFVLFPYLTDEHRQVWLALSKVCLCYWLHAIILWHYILVNCRYSRLLTVIIMILCVVWSGPECAKSLLS